MLVRLSSSQAEGPLPVDYFTLWKGHWPPWSDLDQLSPLRHVFPWEEDQESTGVAGTASPQVLQEACVEHLLAVLMRTDVSTVAHFLVLQDSRTMQTGRTCPQAGAPR